MRCFSRAWIRSERFGFCKPVQGQALIRVLFEVRVDIELFMRACAADPVEAAHKVLDTMTLQKIASSGSRNFSASALCQERLRAKMLEREQQIIAKYGKDTADKVRRHGFSGLSIEERAKHVDLSTEYHIVYRNFSRNIHNTDYMENLTERGAIS